MTWSTSRPNGAMPVVGSQRPNSRAWWTSQAARYASAPPRSYSCSTRITRATAGGRVGWQRQRAWMEVFSSAEMMNSSGSSRRPWNRRWYKSRTTPALAAKAGSRGEIQERCRHGLIASSCSQRHSVDTEIWSIRPVVMTSSRSSARLQRPSGTARIAGSSQAIALTSTITAEGELARPTRPLAVCEPAKPLLDKALASLRHGVDRQPQPPGDRDVLLAVGGGQHDPGPDDLALLGGQPAEPRLQHSPLAGGQGDRKRAGSAHEWLTTSSPAGVVAAPTPTATAASRLAVSSSVERLACSTTTAAATWSDTRPASRNPCTARTSPARTIGVSTSASTAGTAAATSSGSSSATAARSRSSAGLSSPGSGSCIDTSCLGSPTAASSSATTSSSDRESSTNAAERACWYKNALASSASDGPRRTPQQRFTLRPLPHRQRSFRPCWAMTSASWGACFLPRRLRPPRTDQAELTPMYFQDGALRLVLGVPWRGRLGGAFAGVWLLARPARRIGPRGGLVGLGGIAHGQQWPDGDSKNEDGDDDDHKDLHRILLDGCSTAQDGLLHKLIDEVVGYRGVGRPSAVAPHRAGHPGA